MAWGTAPPPSYPTLNPYYMGNVLGNLVQDYQNGQQGAFRAKQDQMVLNQETAFARGVPKMADGSPDWSKIGETLAERGNPNALMNLAPTILQAQNIAGANTADPLLEGYGGTNGPPGSAGGFMGALHEAESGNRNIFSRVDPDPSGPGTRSQGYDQINVPTWLEFAGKAGVNTTRYPTPMSAPESVQDQVAKVIPLDRFGPRTRKILEAKYGFGDDAKNLTIGQLDSRFGGGSATGGQVVKVASLDPAAGAYAASEQPSTPPGSASAAGTIPNAKAPTAEQAVGGPPQTPDQKLAPSNPAWAGINAALPTGQGMGFPALGATSSPAPGTPPDAALGGTAAFYAGLPKETDANAPQRASVTSIVGSAVGDPQRAALVARNIGQLLGVNPSAPLTSQQAQRVAAGVRAYTQRTSAAPQSAAPPQAPRPSGPIIPQFPLPNGFTDPQKAILAIDQDIARLSRFGPAANGRIRALEDMRGRIAASSAPMEVRPGQTIIDPRTGKTLFESPFMSGRYGVTQEKADEIAQAIQNGDQPPVLTGLYGASALVRSSLAQNGFDLSKAQLQWKAAEKQITSLNGPQQVRFVGLANSVVNTIDEVRNLAQQMQLSGVPMFNKAELLAYIQTAGNSEGGQLATRYINAVNTAKEEFANLANGGYAPTDAAWKLADEQINSNYGVKQLDSALSESQRLIKYRLAAMPGMSTTGPGAANRYFPGNEQAPPPPAAQPSSGNGLPPGWSVEVH